MHPLRVQSVCMVNMIIPHLLGPIPHLSNSVVGLYMTLETLPTAIIIRPIDERNPETSPRCARDCYDSNKL